MVVERGRDSHAAVVPAGAADGDGETYFALLNIQGQQKVQHILNLLHEGARLLIAEYIFRHRPVKPAQRPQLVNIEGVRQAPCVENQIRVERDTVLVAEREHRHVQSTPLAFGREQREQLILQHTERKAGAVDDVVGSLPNGL